MIGFYNYSVILTYLGLGSAIGGIVLALDKQPKLAVLCLLVCGLCDMFDGTIARTCKRSDDAKRFGVQIDSLCDLVCFGVFPAMIGWAIGPANWFTVVCMIIYVLAAVIRLAYFNVQEINREREDGGMRAYYEGLPVTSSALIMPIVIMAGVITHVRWTYIYPITLLLMGAAFGFAHSREKALYGGAYGAGDRGLCGVCDRDSLWREHRLYEKLYRTRVGRGIAAFLARPGFSRAAGWFMDTRASEGADSAVHTGEPGSIFRTWRTRGLTASTRFSPAG